MADVEVLDRAHEYCMHYFVANGRAPHYTELAHHLGMTMDEGRQTVHDLVAELPAWLHPDTDLIASLAPFNSLPTQYRISVDGEQKWFGQCGLESLAVSWLFPDKTVQIESPCLDCGESVKVVMRDGEVVESEPTTIVGYAAQGFRGPAEQWPFR